jgi:hypothetical protein
MLGSDALTRMTQPHERHIFALFMSNGQVLQIERRRAYSTFVTRLFLITSEPA